MPKARPSKQPWDVRAADALAGRAAVDAGDLIDLVHEVNPTGRGRGAPETAARYALKSRLQSLLIDRHADEIEVTAAPGDPGVVSIRHRYRRHDACHAVLDTLDDDARAWVQLQLDLAGAAGAASPAPEERRRGPARAAAEGDDDALSDGELLAAGQEAQAEYDYERAGRCFARALEVSGGAVAAAVAFLSFTVDALAADDEALALEARLPAATVADPRVGVLLALAAARGGDEARALRLAGRARDVRVAEVLTLLARRALEAGDTERAGRHLRAAEEQDPAHPDLRALADVLASARAAERAPREGTLDALVTAGRDAEALPEAEAILARWPESEPARRAIHVIEERQREGAGRRHLTDAEESLAQGKTAAALELVHRALACPLPAADRLRALKRQREAEAILHEQEVRARIEQVVALLAEADRARALAAYVELAAAERAAVQARVPLPVLQWLDAIPAARPGGRVRAAVEAVLALARASALAEKDLAGAAALIAAHERLLEELPLARSIEQRARAAAAEERAHRAATDLRDATEALAGGHLARARALFERVDLRALPEGERTRALGLEAELAAAESLHREVRRFERLRGAGAFTAARAAALALSARAERDGSGDRERWAAEAAAIAEQVRSRYAVQVDELPPGEQPEDLLRFPGLHRYGHSISAWVADGARELVLGNGEAEWLFLRFVDLETGQVVRTVRLVLDQPMIDLRLFAHGGGVTVVGNSGLFELALPGGELVQRFVRNWTRDRGPCFSEGLPGEGTRLLWGRYGIDDEVVRIVDLDGEPAVKAFGGFRAFFPVVGATPPRLVLHKSQNGQDEDESTEYHTLQVHEPSGVAGVRAELRWGPEVMVAHPSGAGMVMITQDPHAYLIGRLSVVELTDRLEVIAVTQLALDVAEWPQPRPELVRAHDAGMVFVLFTKVRAAHATLIALRSAGAGRPLVEHYRVPVPLRTRLAHDQSGRRAFALVDHPGGLAVAQLGPEPPVLPASGPVHVLAEAFQNVNWCGLHQHNRAVHVYVALRGLAPPERAAAIARHERERAADPDQMVELVHALLSGDWLEAAARVLERVEATHPQHPGVRIAPFALLVARRAWPELLAALDAGTGLFETPFIQHYHHLAATAHARLGDVDEALRHLTLAEAYTANYGHGHCSYRLLQLRQGFDSLPGAADDLSFDRPTSAQLVAVLRAADIRLTDGDPAGAVAILERPLTWDLHELHSLSRLAAAYLDLPTPSAAARFRKALALATFAECSDDDHHDARREGLAPGLGWPEERIAALRTAAVAWLRADQGGGAGGAVGGS